MHSPGAPVENPVQSDRATMRSVPVTADLSRPGPAGDRGSGAGPRPGRVRHLVVMGVSGTGKTSVATRVADELGWVFVEGDDLHPPGNVAKMSAGVPLEDADRGPWLAALSELLAAHHRAGESCVLTCSSLKRAYRDVLRGRVPEGSVLLVHLTAPFEVLRERMSSRDHFMPPSLLRSQLDTLEPLEAEEDGVLVDVEQPLDGVVRDVLAALSR